MNARVSHLPTVWWPVHAEALLYGVVSYRVRRRTRELGTRVALGATPAAIAGLVLRHAAAVVAVGLAVGIALALASGARFRRCCSRSRRGIR